MAEELNKLAKKWDISRPTTGASNQEDPLNGIPDLIAFNRYFGWYEKKIQDIKPWIEKMAKEYP